MTENKTSVGRRDFLKLAGITTAVGATALGASAIMPKVAKAAYNEPASAGVSMSIKYLDTPSYNLPPYADADKLARFDERNTSFNNAELSAQSFGGQPFYIPYTEGMLNSVKTGKGSLRDYAFAQAADANEALGDLHGWATDYESGFVKEVGPWQDTPENNSLTMKKAATYFGAGAVGVCELNRQWMYTNTARDNGKAIRFTNEVTSPTITETEHLIPETFKYAIVMLVPIDGDSGRFTPTLFGGAVGSLGYSIMSELVNKVAKMCRELGYHAIPCGNHEGLSIPMAIDAGLGELGRHGLLINPEFGTHMKICKVLTDMPLAPDKPIRFGAAEFCKTCKKCATNCPSKSISMADEPSYDVQCPSNNPGMKKWYTNTWTCLEFWINGGAECNVCMRNCTYSKPQTWVHDVIKVTTSKTTVFNSIFAKMDDAFGYGKTWESYTKADIEEWWSNPNVRNFNWTKM